nr:DNA-3-methyladenine glycosylase I [Methanobrevibacter arboriphilus]
MMRNGEKKLQIIIKFLNSYLRTFLPERKPINNHWKTLSEVPSSILLSETIAKDMKKTWLQILWSSDLLRFFTGNWLCK